MATYACKVLTDRGIAYVAYNTVVDQFVTAPLSSATALAEELGETAADWQASADAHVFNMWPRSLDRIALCLYRLRRGEHLSDEDACLVEKLYRFLQATVAPQQYNYPEIDDDILNGWIDELGLRKGRYAEWDAYEITHDGCLYRVIHDVALARKFKSHERNLKRPSVAQRKLTGRYLTKLAQIRNLLGPGRPSPIKVVNDCFEMSKTRRQGE
jgi:hypothetical protein